MRKAFTTLCLFSLGCLGMVLHAENKPFEIECDFDVDAHYPDGATLPAGWTQTGDHFKRGLASGFANVTAHSGEYVLGATFANTADMVFTPMMKLAGGEPCTIEFQFCTPNLRLPNTFNYSLTVTAGTAQEVSAQTIAVGSLPSGEYKEWRACKFTFTPEADGEYCFALNPTPTSDSFATYCNNVAFDSFIFTGTGEVAGEDPIPADAIVYNFDNDEDFPALATLPAGWLSIGAKPFMRKTTATLQIPVDAPSGQYVIGNVGTSMQNNQLLYTPLYDVKAGEAATMKFKFYAPTDNVIFGYGFHIYTVPSQDTPIAEANLIGTIAEDIDRVREFIQSETFSYTPEADGQIAFLIVPFNSMGYAPGGSVAFDDFVLTGVKVHEDEPEPGPAPEPGKAFESEYNFDIDADFPDGAVLPAGWAQEGTREMTRMEPTALGFFFPQGGDYVLGTPYGCKFDEVVYTPMMKLAAGNPCTIEFYYLAPGGTPATVRNIKLTVKAGTAQTKEAQTIIVKDNPNEAVADWKKYTCTFTPETTGDYCFSLWLEQGTGMGGDSGCAMFDTFFISGVSPVEEPPTPVVDLEPNEDNLVDCIELPYFEKFDGTNYTGDTYLPIKWHSTGTVTWQTGGVPGLVGHNGNQWYLTANHNLSDERDDKVYTPFFNLTAGTEYTISYWSFIQGNDWNEDEILYLPELSFTVGTEQDAEFHCTLEKFSEKNTTWVQRTHKFTPEKSGAYCFAFMLTGPVNSGIVAIDDFSITAEGLIARVEPGFAPMGLYSIMESGIHVFEGQPVKMVNTSKYADTYKWTAEGAEPSTSTEESPEFTFSGNGTYTVTLEATNQRGSRTTARNIKVNTISKLTPEDQVLHVYNKNADRMYQRGQVPTFDTDPEGDFVTGFNHYYFDLAQRFDFSEEIPVKIKQLTAYVCERRYRNQTSFYDDQRARPFSIVFYGAKADGSLDEENVLGRLDTTIGEALGSSGLGGINSDPKDIAFAEPIEVRGTFYVAMHFDRGMEVIPQDAILGRSYICTSAVRHGHGSSTLYVKPFDKPANSAATLNEWAPVDVLDVKQKGLGAYWLLWCSAYDQAASAEAIGPDGSVTFAATFMGDNLCVSGTSEGETVRVFNINGALVASAPAQDGATAVAVPALPAGIYIVSCGDNTAKAAK